MSLDKKLKRLKISKDDIDIIYEGDCTPSELESKYIELTQIKKEETQNEDTKLFYFLNRKTGESFISIYPVLTIDNVKNFYDYERCSKKDIESYRYSHGKV